MGATGAVIMGFFGAVFAAITLATQWGWSGAHLGLPFLIFAAIALAAYAAHRLPGTGPSPSPQAERVIMWATIAEGVGLFVAANLVANIGHREWLLPAMALVVGLHFLPIGWAVPFRPFLALGGALLAASALGFVLQPPLGPELAGFAAALALWTAATIAVLRERRAKASPAA